MLRIFSTASFTDSTIVAYAMACGRTLARAHARSGDSVKISAYLGASAKFDKAIRDFSISYADQVEKDFALYTTAIADGSVVVAKPGEGENYRVVATPSDGVSVVTFEESVDPAPTSS